MDVGGAFGLRWEHETDQAAAENLVFLAQEPAGAGAFDQSEIECQVTEEVITDDWVQPQGQERVDVPLERLAVPSVETHNEGNDIDVPLPTDQDEYTAMRPYPCDFCSRRFRKKANLMNHMVAHQNDRPYGCNLCGARYVRRSDLLNHLKVHAFVPEDGEEDVLQDITAPKRKSRKRSEPSSYNYAKSAMRPDKTAVAARTQQYEGSANATPPPLRVRYEATDPSRPFVCQHCGVGFAREKALASHARVHGGDSPIECNVCGELCWSRENLAAHMRIKHQNKNEYITPEVEDNNMSSEESEAAEDEEGNESWVELVCKDCGAGFQRADLLQRHVKAAHSHIHARKDTDMNNSRETIDDDDNADDDNWNNLDRHACSVCGETFSDALQLLAHAESHARSRSNRCVSCGEKFADRAAMVDHISFAHPDLPPNTCLFCGRSCADERALSKHIAAQHEIPDNMLFCPKCGKSFRNKPRLKRHMMSHRDKAVTCAVCGESFADGRSLMNHRHSHKGSTARQFPCHECGKTFGSRSSQQIHIRIHTGERPYGCRFCWKAFADGGTLRKHERIHTGERPYACAICPRAFNQRVVLREHIRSHHSGPDARHGTNATPYWCQVCNRLMATSNELVHHLIEHCDNNTAMKRQPQLGPRKYKRRRKASPLNIKFEAERNNSTDSELSDGANNKVPATPLRKAKETPSSRETRKRVVPSPAKKQVDETSNAEGSARTKGKLRAKNVVVATKPKMIHTEKSKPPPPVEGEGAMTRRRARSNVVTTTATPMAPSNVSTTPTSRVSVRPRTKNVNYRDVVERLPQATFSDAPKAIKPEPPGSDPIADDLRAIFDDSTADVREEESMIDEEEQEVASTSHGRNIKNEVSDEEEDDESDGDFNIKQELSSERASRATTEDGLHRCEMCAESFSAREQLLTHVRIHI